MKSSCSSASARLGRDPLLGRYRSLFLGCYPLRGRQLSLGWRLPLCVYLLLGWFLMVPPTGIAPDGRRAFVFNAPLRQWYRWDFYDTAEECWYVDRDLFLRSESVLRIDPLNDAANAYLEARCVPTDDPRLAN
jgi:hypothetical protein